MPTRRFYKVTGSGNDFLVFDERTGSDHTLTTPGVIQSLCERGTGVGADGIVLLQPAAEADFRMIYYNQDGSRASMCGNAALCVTALAARLGAGKTTGMRFDTDSGRISARVREGVPEIDMEAVSGVQADAPVQAHAGELRIGFALAGVPHLVVRRGSVEDIDVVARGCALRHDPALGAAGANVNFVSPGADGGWRIRTYERGVEGETLACGTGAVAAAVLLNVWGESGDQTRLTTRSGRDLLVRLRRDGALWLPSLSGEGRLVFIGELADEGSS